MTAPAPVAETGGKRAYRPASPTTLANFFTRIEAEVMALRESAHAMNETYAHSGLTNPRADRLLTRADGMEYVLATLRDEYLSER